MDLGLKFYYNACGMQSIEEKIELGQSKLDQGDYQEAFTIFTEVITENSEKWMAWRGLGFANTELGNIDDAIKAFGKATLIRNDDVMSQYGYGIAYQKAGDNAKAIKAFEEALRQDHKHPESKRAICVSLMAQVENMRNIGNLLAVEEYLEKAHKFDPSNEDVTIQLFRYYERTGQATKLDSAMTEMRRHEIPIPNREDYAPLEVSDESADLPTTLPELKALVASKNDQWMAWRAIGNLELESGNAQLAHDAFKTATVIRSDDVESQFGFGRALQELGDHSHAIRAFEEALRHDKQHSPTKKALNKSLMSYVDNMRQIGNLLAVEQYLERAHKNDIGDESVTAQLLGYYDETGQSGKKHGVIKDLELHGLPVPEPSAAGVVSQMPSQQASEDLDIELNSIDELTAHLESHHEDWRHWRQLGFAYIEANQPKLAVDAFKTATVVRFDDAESQYGLGLAHQLQGDHAGAIHPFEAALHNDKNHVKAREALKLSLLGYSDHMREIGNLLAVEQFLEKAHKCDPEDADTARKLLDYYRETGQGSKSAKIAQEMGFNFTEADEVHVEKDNTGADLLLSEDRLYKQEAPDEAETLGITGGMNQQSGASQPKEGSRTVGQQPVYDGDIPAMLPCPACKQMMPSRSRLCPHCSKMVDAIGGGIMTRGNEQDVKASKAGRDTAKKGAGCGSVMMTFVLVIATIIGLLASGVL
ncbi:MAG: tetratricopeptide repeat protein [Fimbriimonadaceae bacterium]